MKADVPTAAQWRTQADGVKIVPFAVILIAVVIQNVAAVPVPAAVTTPVLLEAAVAVQTLLEATVAVQALSEAAAVQIGAMFPMEKQKDVLFQKAREVAVVLPVHQKEVTAQEDNNLFLY